MRGERGKGGIDGIQKETKPEKGICNYLSSGGGELPLDRERGEKGFLKGGGKEEKRSEGNTRLKIKE